LKHRWSGWRAALLFPKDLEAQHRIGLKPSAKHTVMNGPLACTWAVYELFKGKRIDHLTGNVEGAETAASDPASSASVDSVGEEQEEGATVRFRRPRIQQQGEEN